MAKKSRSPRGYNGTEYFTMINRDYMLSLATKQASAGMELAQRIHLIALTMVDKGGHATFSDKTMEDLLVIQDADGRVIKAPDVRSINKAIQKAISMSLFDPMSNRSCVIIPRVQAKYFANTPNGHECRLHRDQKKHLVVMKGEVVVDHVSDDHDVDCSIPLPPGAKAGPSQKKNLPANSPLTILF